MSTVIWQRVSNRKGANIESYPRYSNQYTPPASYGASDVWSTGREFDSRSCTVGLVCVRI